MRKNIFTKATMRRAAAFGLAGCMAAASLTGCGSSKTESTTAANAETKVEAEGESKAEAADGSDIHVGIIFTEAGLSGNSFNDLALEGVKKAADDYGITYDEVEPKSVSDEEIIQDEMASSGEYDLIICVGAEQVDALTNVATTYPDQKFALLDANSDLDNVASYSCKEQEGAFLAGALAVLAKQEKIDDKLNDGKVIGFIGVNLNQNEIAPDYIMASMLKKLDSCAYHAKVVFNCDTCDTNEKELATQMVGRQVESIVTKAEDPHGPVVLELKNVRLHKRAQETVSIQVHAGEIFGIAGVDGNGQQELEEMIVGNRKTEEGTISMNGKEVQNLSVKERKAMGLGYIPSDRHKDAMVPDFSITENFLLGYQEDPKYCKKGFIDYKALEEDAKVQVEQFEIKIAGVSQHIGQLSGGNQQKVILGRETSHDPSFMLVAQPVRGLDIGAIERVHKTLLQLKKEGKAILLISAELSEVMNLSDRIAVLYEGEMSAQFKAGQYTKEEIGLFMAGKKQEDMANEMDQQ